MRAFQIVITKTLKFVRNSTTCNFRISDPMAIDILASQIWKRAYESGLYTNFALFFIQKILNNNVLSLLLFTASINKIEKSNQPVLNFIFYEILEHFNFFCLKTFPSPKKLLVNTNFVKTRLYVNTVHEKLRGNSR